MAVQRGKELEERVYREAEAECTVHGTEVGSKAWEWAVQGALDRLSEEEADTLYEYWSAQE